MMGKYFNEYPVPAEPGRATWRRRCGCRTYVAPGLDQLVGSRAWQRVHPDALPAERQRRASDRAFNARSTSTRSWAHRRRVAAGGAPASTSSAAGSSSTTRRTPRTRRTPIRPSTPAPSGTCAIPGRRTSTSDDVTDKFGVTRSRKPLTAEYGREIDAAFRDRIRSVQVLDRNVASWSTRSPSRGSSTTPTSCSPATTATSWAATAARSGSTTTSSRRSTCRSTSADQVSPRAPRIEDPAGNIDIAPTIADMAVPRHAGRSTGSPCCRD